MISEQIILNNLQSPANLLKCMYKYYVSHKSGTQKYYLQLGFYILRVLRQTFIMMLLETFYTRFKPSGLSAVKHKRIKIKIVEVKYPFFSNTNTQLQAKAMPVVFSETHKNNTYLCLI